MEFSNSNCKLDKPDEIKKNTKIYSKIVISSVGNLIENKQKYKNYKLPNIIKSSYHKTKKYF